MEVKIDNELAEEFPTMGCNHDALYTPNQIINKINDIQSSLDKIKSVVGIDEEAYTNLLDIGTVAKIRKYTRDVKFQLKWLIRDLNRLENDLVEFDQK